MKRTYRVYQEWHEHEVVLEADHDVLTPELATLINQFWSDDDERLDVYDGDPVKAVIHFAGTCLINQMLCEGGADFDKSNDTMSTYWTGWLTHQEGWPPADQLGIRCVAAEVTTPRFDDLSMDEIAA